MLEPCARVWLLSGVWFVHDWVSFLWEPEHEGPCRLIWGKHLALGAHKPSWMLLRLDLGGCQGKWPLNHAYFTNGISRELKVSLRHLLFPIHKVLAALLLF